MMNCKMYTLMLGLLAFLVSDFSSLAYADSNKIGFVNLKRIFRDYKKVKEMEQRINRETEAEYSKIKGLEEEVKQLREEIPLYRPGSKIRKRKEKELTNKLFEIKYRTDKAKYFFAEKMKAGIEKVYQEIISEVTKYAKKKRFFMIITVSDPDFFGTQSADALRMQINTRDVLYWNKENDITNKIIEHMNKKHQKEREIDR